MMRKFRVKLDVYVEIDDRLFVDVLNDEWRSRFYPLRTDGDLAVHLAFNLSQGRSLGSLDGFADQPDDRVSCDVSASDDDDVVEIE